MLDKNYASRPELFITRFAVQPRWKNSGTTPVVNMKINVDFCETTKESPPDFSFRKNSQKFFLAPNATEPSEYFEVPQVRSIIDQSLTCLSQEPIVLIWGRADYEDIFGELHFIHWCYRLRLDDHKGDGLRATFIQWGDYNLSDFIK